MRNPTIALLVLLFGMSGCAGIGYDRVTDSRAEGRIVNNVYTSPNQSFRFRLPWLSANATLRDERPTPNSILVTIADDLCRVFFVLERPGFLVTESLQSWVDTYVVEDLKRLGFAVRSKALTTRYGTAIALRYRAPAAAPCGKEGNGKEFGNQLDADVAWYIYYRDGVFYQLIYVVGTGPEAPSLWYINREPVDEVLAQFAAGFEILEAKPRQGSAD